MPVLFASFWHYFFSILMFALSLFLILLVLVQRGRGGGLAGAFGGLGGQSAFGAKAGDLFTRITMIAAGIWLVLCMAAIKVLNSPPSRFGSAPTKFSAPAKPGGTGESAKGTPAAPAGQSPSPVGKSDTGAPKTKSGGPQ